MSNSFSGDADDGSSRFIPVLPSAKLKSAPDSFGEVISAALEFAAEIHLHLAQEGTDHCATEAMQQFFKNLVASKPSAAVRTHEEMQGGATQSVKWLTKDDAKFPLDKTSFEKFFATCSDEQAGGHMKTVVAHAPLVLLIPLVTSSMMLENLALLTWLKKE